MYICICVCVRVYIQPVHFYDFTNVRIKYKAIRTAIHEVLGISETFFKSQEFNEPFFRTDLARNKIYNILAFCT